MSSCQFNWNLSRSAVRKLTSWVVVLAKVSSVNQVLHDCSLYDTMWRKTWPSPTAFQNKLGNGDENSSKLCSSSCPPDCQFSMARDRRRGRRKRNNVSCVKVILLKAQRQIVLFLICAVLTKRSQPWHLHRGFDFNSVRVITKCPSVFIAWSK
jgi:hypothetical protein